MTISTPSGPVIVGPGRQITPAELEADDWADDLIRERLPALRTLGGRWAASIAALTGLFGIGTVIGADDVVRALHEPWGLIYGLLVAAAVTAAATATYLAGEVAAGGLHDIPPGVEERVLLKDRLYEEGTRQLRLSRLVTGAAVLLLGISFAVRWYAPVTT